MSGESRRSGQSSLSTTKPTTARENGAEFLYVGTLESQHLIAWRSGVLVCRLFVACRRDRTYVQHMHATVEYVEYFAVEEVCGIPIFDSPPRPARPALSPRSPQIMQCLYKSDDKGRFMQISSFANRNMYIHTYVRIVACWKLTQGFLQRIESRTKRRSGRARMR